MTVEQLIKKLQKVKNQKAKVYLYDQSSPDQGLAYFLDRISMGYSQDDNTLTIIGENSECLLK